MRTALFFIAMSIFDCSDKSVPDGSGSILLGVVLIFLVMDVFELTKK